MLGFNELFCQKCRMAAPQPCLHRDLSGSGFPRVFTREIFPAHSKPPLLQCAEHRVYAIYLEGLVRKSVLAVAGSGVNLKPASRFEAPRAETACMFVRRLHFRHLCRRRSSNLHLLHNLESLGLRDVDHHVCICFRTASHLCYSLRHCCSLGNECDIVCVAQDSYA